MQPYTYESIRKSIRAWYHHDFLKLASDSAAFEISKDEKEAMIIDMTFEHCLAQLIVSMPGFAPYQFVSFEAMTYDPRKASVQGGFERIYDFYDAIGMTVGEVMDALNLGVKCAMEYQPNG